MAQQQKQQDIQELDYIKLFFHCLHKWYWFLACTVVCAGVAFFYLQHKTNVYSVASTIMIRTDNNLSRSSLQADMLQVMGYQTSKIIPDEIQIITSYTLMEQTVRTLNLQTEYRKKQGMRWVGQYPTPDVMLAYPNGCLDTLRSAVQINLERTKNDYLLEIVYRDTKTKIHVPELHSAVPTPLGFLTFTEVHPLAEGDKMRIRTLPVQACANSFRAALNCAPSNKESNVIVISMASDMPKRSVDVIAKVIELYNMDAVIDKNIMATNTANFINERLQIVEAELSDVETAVESYMKQNGLTNLSQELTQVLNSQTSYQKELTSTETQIELLDFLRDYLNNAETHDALIPSNVGVNDASLQQLVKEYNSLLLQRMRIARSVTETSPVFQQTEEQLRTLRQAILASVDNIRQGLLISKADLEKKNREFNSKIHQVPEKERRYVEIKRQQEIKEKLYIYLYQKREENALTLASTVMPAKVIDEPIVTSSPVSPKKKRIWLVALLLGLGLPFAVIFLLDYLNDEVKDLREFQSVVKAPYLGSVMYQPQEDVVAVDGHKNTAQAELFRTIRTNLRFMLPDKKCPVILITSALNGEGKSFVAINTAISLALLKKRVILVGMDIRKPTLAKYMHIDFKGHLTSYLLDPDVKIDDMIIQSGVTDNLDVMPAGAIPPNPGELIQSPRVATLFEDLKERYDYIVVDTSPLYLVSDTFHLDKFSDLCIFVTRANYISREMLPYIQTVYEQQKLHNMACVLNGVSGGKRGYGYGRYGYGYGYGYGHGYGYGYGHGKDGYGYYSSNEE